MALTALYRKYFQKSKIFLYPLLDIKKGTTTVPIDTYFSWEGKYNLEDMKLVCIYKTSNTPGYLAFEKTVLLKHSRLCDYFKIDNETSVFIFDFYDLSDDWFHVANGKYSKINDVLKRKILTYFNDSSANYKYINSYLYPQKFFAQYASILDVPESLLISVGELCDKPDLNKESLKIKIPDLQT
jgi:hypothetical protein